MTRQPARQLWLPIAMTVVAGALLPAQFATNTALSRVVRSVTLAGAISYAVGVASLVLMLAAQRTSPDWRGARHAPPWAWLGGVVGSAYVVGSVLLTQALGAALATTVVIAAQVVMAVLLDHFGALGLERRRVNRARLAAVLLVLAALAIRFVGTT